MSISKKAQIHPSSVIEDGAVIADDVVIGPFCHIGSDVTLAKGVELKSHVVIAGHTEIGEETRVWPFASLGHMPQDLKYKGERTKLEVGARNQIRENVTMNTGTAGGGGLTKIGDDCLFMVSSHIGHDSILGNRVILAPSAAVGGHCQIEDNVLLGDLAGVHQWCRIGRGAMVGAMAAVVADVIPMGTVTGERASLEGLNLVGLKRAGVDRGQINGLRAAFKDLFLNDLNVRDNVVAAREKYADNPLVIEVLDFIEADTRRSLTIPH